MSTEKSILDLSLDRLVLAEAAAACRVPASTGSRSLHPGDRPYRFNRYPDNPASAIGQH
jgi:hypothetical protein